MKKFTLSSSFHIGHEDIDADHLELVDIVNALIDRFKALDLEGCNNKWQHFCERLEQHFDEEEQIMTGLDYSDPHHITYHQEIVEQTRRMGKGCKTLDDWSDFILEMMNTLIVMILSHDLKFAAHLRLIKYVD